MRELGSPSSWLGSLKDRYLDHDEASTILVCTGKVNSGLVIGNIKALDTLAASLKRTRNGSCEEQEQSGELHGDMKME